MAHCGRKAPNAMTPNCHQPLYMFLDKTTSQATPASIACLPLFFYGQVTLCFRVGQWLFAKQKSVVLTYLLALYHNVGGYASV